MGDCDAAAVRGTVTEIPIVGASPRLRHVRYQGEKQARGELDAGGQRIGCEVDAVDTWAFDVAGHRAAPFPLAIGILAAERFDTDVLPCALAAEGQGAGEFDGPDPGGVHWHVVGACALGPTMDEDIDVLASDGGPGDSDRIGDGVWGGSGAPNGRDFDVARRRPEDHFKTSLCRTVVTLTYLLHRTQRHRRCPRAPMWTAKPPTRQNRLLIGRGL